MKSLVPELAYRWCSVRNRKPLPRAPRSEASHKTLGCSHYQPRAGSAQAVSIGGRQGGGGGGGGGGVGGGGGWSQGDDG